MNDKAETYEQIDFVAMVKSFYPDVVIHSIPNGNKRMPTHGAVLKKEGLLAGVPDLFIAEARGGYHGLYIEMKRRLGGKTSVRQELLLERLRSRGYKAEVCNGAKKAWVVFESYILQEVTSACVDGD